MVLALTSAVVVAAAAMMVRVLLTTTTQLTSAAAAAAAAAVVAAAVVTGHNDGQHRAAETVFVRSAGLVHGCHHLLHPHTYDDVCRLPVTSVMGTPVASWLLETVATSSARSGSAARPTQQSPRRLAFVGPWQVVRHRAVRSRRSRA